MSTRKHNIARGGRLYPLLLVLTGAILMGYMIIVEDEPGAIPLLLIITGSAWYYFGRKGFRSGQKSGK